MHLRPFALCALVLLLGLGACSSASKKPQTETVASPSAAAAVNKAEKTAPSHQTETEFADALVAPLADLNLVRTPIRRFC